MKIIKRLALINILSMMSITSSAQSITDTIQPAVDSLSLRIINLNANFIQHVDSSNVYQFRINRDPSLYYWYIKNAPVGLTINKDNGKLSFKVAKNYFLSGKLKYDYPYNVGVTVQSLEDPNDKIDTAFFISFYNTEIIPSMLKLSVSGVLTIDEGETVSFRVQCESGSFPFESILFNSTVSIKDYTLVKLCNDEFNWTPGFDFVKETDPNKEKSFTVGFIGITRFQAKDTATVRIVVKNALNYPQANLEFDLVNKNIRSYILQLKFAFKQIDKRLKKVKTFRTGFDLTSASTALTGTILNTSSSESAQRTGKILPSVGVAIVPIKEATAPNKSVEQNQASQIRSTIKRLEYLLTDNVLVGERDIDIVRKTNKLKDELKQAQVQLIDIPVEISADMTEENLNNYFNSPKVNKKYRLKGK
jgi:hypothetical protein